MKLFIALIACAYSLFAVEYYAKVEPIHNYVIKSAVSGKVVYVNDAIEGQQANNSMIVQIDNYVNKVELRETKKKLEAINSMINLEDTNYNRLKKLTSKSGFEKDNQKIKVINLQTQQSDLKIRIATLEDTIKNKELKEAKNYIYNIAVKEGDYVNPGTTLYEAKDLSKGKVEIFIPIADVQMIQTKAIYLDGEKSDLKIDKIYKVADAKHISSYKCEIIIPNIKSFSRLVQIEFK